MLPLLHDQALAAQGATDPAAHSYVASGAGDEVSLGEAEQAWRDWRFVPSVLAGVDVASPAVTLLGADLATPVLAGPTAYHRLVHPDGELATAAGVAAAGSLMVLSSRATVAVEEVASTLAATGTPWWWQSYVVAEREVTAGLARRAAEAGARAVVLTGDTPYVGVRSRPDAAPMTVTDELIRVNTDRHRTPGSAGPVAQVAARLDDIAWLADLTGLPVFVKGVLSGADARRCLDAGAAGIVVSNHGGRQLDRAVATARALPGVVDAVAGQVPVLVDGGLRSGLDVLVALALGADAVLLGRPVVWGLAADGAPGVTAALGALTADLVHALGLLGVADLPSLRALGRSCLVPAGPVGGGQ